MPSTVWVDSSKVAPQREKTPSIPIEWLNPDCDGDGTVEKWEKDVFKHIQAADEDKSGSISAQELFKVIRGANEAEKAKRQYRNLFGGAVIVIFMLVGSMLAVSIAAGEMVKETHVKSATLDDGANNVLKTAPAIEKLPLFAAPVLPLSQLAEIKTLQATIGSSAVKDIYMVTHVSWHSSTRVAFSLAKQSHTLKVWDGDAFVEDASANRIGSVCLADVTCSALIVDSAEESETLMGYATGNLTEAGIPIPGSWDGRRRLVDQGRKLWQIDEHGRALWGGGARC